MKREKIVLGIDTSNYTTSLCIVNTDGEVLRSIKAPLQVKAGEVGLRQSDAVFSHTKNLPEVFERADGLISECEVVSVGVSDRPRDVEGSYMPCFLSGVAVATALSESMGVPLYTNSHQAGHIEAAMYSSGMLFEYTGEEFISFHVSGGTTEMLKCKKTNKGIEAELIGKTLDLNAGQAIDSTGVMLGLDFPCGVHIEKLALDYYREHGKVGGFGVCVKGLDCCLSGVENLAKGYYDRTSDAKYTSAFVLEYIAKTLIKMTDAALEKYGKMPLLYAGGVMSNSIIKERIREKYPYARFAFPEFSSDNAAGTALLTLEKYITENPQ